MTRHTLLDEYTFFKTDSDTYLKYEPVLSKLILKNFGKPYYNSEKIKKILNFCARFYSKEFEKICSLETSFTFYKMVFGLNEQASKFRIVSKTKNNFSGVISEDYVSMYRRILKMILEQGCLVDMQTEEKITKEVEERFLLEFNDLLFLGEKIYHSCESYAEQQMIEDVNDISFDERNLYVISRRHHYEDAFSQIVDMKVWGDNKWIMDPTGEEDFNIALNTSHGFSSDHVTALFFEMFKQKNWQPGHVASFKKEDLGIFLHRNFEINVENCNNFFEGLTLSKKNKLKILDLARKSNSPRRFLYRPILIWNINNNDCSVFGLYSYREAISNVIHNAIPWGNAPEEWLIYPAIREFAKQKCIAHDAWLDDAVEDKIKKVSTLYQRDVKKIKTLKSFININNASCGQLDFIVINEKIKKVFVIECKHLVTRSDMSNWKADYANFREGKRAFNNTIERKVNFVKANLTNFTEHFKFREERDDINFVGYEVQGIFIINTPTFYMYYSPYRIFVFHDVEKVLNDEYIDKVYTLHTIGDRVDSEIWMKYPYFIKKKIFVWKEPDFDGEYDKYGEPIIITKEKKKPS